MTWGQGTGIGRILCLYIFSGIPDFQHIIKGAYDPKSGAFFFFFLDGLQEKVSLSIQNKQTT